jgi:UTP-glucose-1-phosphate uridylyltransferase
MTLLEQTPKGANEIQLTDAIAMLQQSEMLKPIV